LLSRAFLVFSFGDAEGGFVHAGPFLVFVLARVDPAFRRFNPLSNQTSNSKSAAAMSSKAVYLRRCAVDTPPTQVDRNPQANGISAHTDLAAPAPFDGPFLQ
jgi:hypothetical protein